MPKKTKITKSQRASVQKEHVKHVTAGGYDAGCTLDYDSAHNSAYWYFEQQKHHIRIGENCLQIVDAPKPTALAGFLKSLYRHERAHALYTVRDLKAVQDECKKEGVPFRLLNLFEDCRVENRYRKKERTYYRWKNWIDIPAPAPDAIALMYRFKLLENHRSLRRASCAIGGEHHVNWRKSDGQILSSATVHFYYRQTLQAASTWKLIPIVKAYMTCFEIDPSTADTHPYTAGDMETAADNSDKPLIGGDASRAGNDPSRVRKTSTRTGTQRDHTNPDTWPKDQTARGRRYSLPVNLDDAALVTAALAPMMTEGEADELGEAGDALHMPSLATLDLNRLFETQDTSERGKPRVLVLTDMSGSMGCGDPEPIQHAKAINIGIAASPAVDSTHIFTSKEGAKEVPRESVTVETLAAADCNSGQEGIGAYLNRKAGELTQYDAILCITDADLTGKVPDWTLLERKGVTNISAVYVGDTDQSQTLKKYYRKHLSARTVADVAARIRQLLT